MDDILNKVFEGINKQSGNHLPEEKSTLTLWVSKECKGKFDSLQSRTKKEFGKRLQKLIAMAIDKVDVV